MGRWRILVARVAGSVRSVAVGAHAVPVPWAPGVRAVPGEGGVLLEGAPGASSGGPEIPVGGWAMVGGRPTACLAGQPCPTGRFAACLGTDLVGASPAMLGVFHRIVLAAHAAEPVLLLGESGTGKDLLARAVHDLGARPDGRYLAVNVAALPAELVETELFGCVRGAFTGADRGRPGVFEAGNGGTVFLDELAEAPPATQAKLLRAVECGAVRRVGSSQDIPIRVRLVAATHRDPVQAVAQGRLREDLMERLACVVVRVPPLRMRLEDLPALVAQLGGGRFPDPAALAVLAAHAWPGNVRELRNVLARARRLGGGVDPGAEALREAIVTGWRGGQVAAPAVRGSRRRQIAESGLPRSTFYYRLKRQGQPGAPRSGGGTFSECAS